MPGWLKDIHVAKIKLHAVAKRLNKYSYAADILGLNNLAEDLETEKEQLEHAIAILEDAVTKKQDGDLKEAKENVCKTLNTMLTDENKYVGSIVPAKRDTDVT